MTTSPTPESAAGAATTSLSARLTAPASRRRVIDDCVQLIDSEVARKGGFSGAAIKLAYSTVKAVKPGFIAEAVDHLLDDFAKRLDPFYQAFLQARSQGNPRSLVDQFSAQGSQVADALLGITDERARRAQNDVVKKSYEKLRPSAKKHVEEAVPGLSRVIEKHTA